MMYSSVYSDLFRNSNRMIIVAKDFLIKSDIQIIGFTEGRTVTKIKTWYQPMVLTGLILEM